MEFLEKENEMVVTRGWWWRKWGDVAQSVQTSSYKMNNFQITNVQNSDYN